MPHWHTVIFAFSLVWYPTLQGCKLNYFTFPTLRLQYCYYEGADCCFSHKANSLPRETHLWALFVPLKPVDTWLFPGAEKEYTLNLYQHLWVQSNTTKFTLVLFVTLFSDSEKSNFFHPLSSCRWLSPCPKHNSRNESYQISWEELTQTNVDGLLPFRRRWI